MVYASILMSMTRHIQPDVITQTAQRSASAFIPLRGSRSIPSVVADQISQDLRWVPRDNRIFRHVFSHGASRPDDRVSPDRQPGKDCGTRTNRGSIPNYRSFHFPVSFGL